MATRVPKTSPQVNEAPDDKLTESYVLAPVQSRHDFGNDITTKESRVSIDYQDAQVRIIESSNSFTHPARGTRGNYGRSPRSTMGSPATAYPTVPPLLWIGQSNGENASS